LEAPPPIRPKSNDMSFDVDRALASVVGLRATVPADAFTASILGVERVGSGVVIRESGLVLTIGYLITEAESVWLTAPDGRVIPAHPMLYDQETGFGLVQSLGPLDLPALEFGRSSEANVSDLAVIASGGQQSTRTRIAAKQEFAGYWEYLLEEALFISPAHPAWSGAGLIDQNGKLLGIGSLILQQGTERGAREDLNMVVPIDLLAPILNDFLAHGRINKHPRPWLGLYAVEAGARVVVADVAPKGPSATSGLRQGDIIAAVRDSSIGSLAGFYRQLWGSGQAGVEIPMEVVRDKRTMWLRVKSADRNDYLKKPRPN
jgi:S1-C subfamily serine protease